MAKPLFKKIEFSTIILLVLTFTVMTSFFPKAKAETEIISIAPSSGNVGTSVQLIANISTENGEYTVKFDELDVASGNAVEYEVNATFNVPDSLSGNHTILVTDVTAGENGTRTFEVLTSYSLEVLPKVEPPAQLQEGDGIQILLNITGGEENKQYIANVTVQAPNNVSYTRLLDVPTSAMGSGNETITYPNDFSADANTSLTGEYKIFFNTTLATETFFIGLTNSTEYHRFQTVDVKAVYKPNENVTLTIAGQELHHSANLTADAAGTVRYTNWTIPSNASIGTYTISITSVLGITKKEPPDIQNFTVPGFAANITTRNLAGKQLPDVVVQVFEEGKSVVNSTSDSEGLVSLMLEIGNYMCKAYLRDKKVGELWINVTGIGLWDFECSITGLKILVLDEAENLIPEAQLYLTPENQTFITDINGTAMISLLPNVTYTINASRYDMLFNTTIIPQLPIIDWFNITIVCPTITLQVNVTYAGNLPINNAAVKVQEIMGGLYYEANTADGLATLECTFGKYTAKVYAEGIKLNETSIELFQNQNVSINCKYYGLNVSVRVVDYFGQSIPNVNVTLKREGLPQYSELTRSNGVATFNNIIGGKENTQITVYLAGQTQPCAVRTSLVDESKTIEVRIEKYVVLAGFFVKTSYLATVIIILATVILILLIEIYRTRRIKTRKGSS